MTEDNTSPPTAAPLDSALKQKTALHESLETPRLLS